MTRLRPSGLYAPSLWTADELRTFAAEICPSCPVDLGVVRAVKVLRDAEIATVESCDGSEGHGYPEPIIRFEGTPAEGWRAISVLMAFGDTFPIRRLSRTWAFSYGAPRGPFWELTFKRVPSPSSLEGTTQ